MEDRIHVHKLTVTEDKVTRVDLKESAGTECLRA